MHTHTPRRRRWTAVLLAGMLLALLISAGSAAAQQPESRSLIEELAERLLTPTFTTPTGSPPSVALYPGVLPADLPFELTVPPGGRLVGSAVRTGFSRVDYEINIVIDAPGDPASVVRFYERDFATQGWSMSQADGPASARGFRAVNEVLFANLCRSERGPWLSLSVAPRMAAPNDVRLTLNNISGPCSSPVRSSEPPFSPPGQNLVPLIEAPAGVTIVRSTPTIGPGLWASFAVAESTVAVGEIEAAVAAQLREAGWVREDGRAEGPMAWSVWATPGAGDWQGTLTVLAGPGDGQRTLQIQVTSPVVPVNQPAPVEAP